MLVAVSAVVLMHVLLFVLLMILCLVLVEKLCQRVKYFTWRLFSEGLI